MSSIPRLKMAYKKNKVFLKPQKQAKSSFAVPPKNLVKSGDF
jgi:hypothetical protein